MLLDLNVTGVPVLVAGLPDESRSAVRRLARAGALVSVLEHPDGIVPADLPADAAARLVIAVGAASTWACVAELRRRLLVVDEPAAPAEPSPGKVLLVGAGPGGAGLLTLDAVSALAQADVVLTDRLASIGDLARFAPGADIIDVGKRPGHHAVPQSEIEALMVDRAARGLTVVRLKGGDPFVFGRGGEEVDACVAAGLPVTVVAGVSSAIAVPGSAGIPVTHRGVSHAFTVVSGHQPLTAEQARGLASVGGTVVVLMGVHNLVPITTALLTAGLADDTPAAIVERGLCLDSRSVVAPLSLLAATASRADIASPAVIVIGEVVRLSQVWAEQSSQPRALPAAGHDDPAPRAGQASLREQAQRHTASSRLTDRGRALTGARA